MKLNYKRTLLVGFAFLSICTFWQMYDSIIPLILQITRPQAFAVCGLFNTIISADYHPFSETRNGFSLTT